MIPCSFHTRQLLSLRLPHIIKKYCRYKITGQIYNCLYPKILNYLFHIPLKNQRVYNLLAGNHQAYQSSTESKILLEHFFFCDIHDSKLADHDGRLGIHKQRQFNQL